jgi:hypothetical protein
VTEEQIRLISQVTQLKMSHKRVFNL